MYLKQVFQSAIQSANITLKWHFGTFFQPVLQLFGTFFVPVMRQSVYKYQ